LLLREWQEVQEVSRSVLSKHRKGKERNDDVAPAPEQEMFQCDFCKKKFPYSYPAINDKPFLFVVAAAKERRSMSLLVCAPDLELFEEKSFSDLFAPTVNAFTSVFKRGESWT
jgi:hypothetical protein